MRFFLKIGFVLGLVVLAREVKAAGPQSPVVIAAIPDTMVIEDFGSNLFFRDLTSVFSDSDNATLFFSVQVLSSNITATVLGANLFLSARTDSSGEADIVITADDLEGQVTSDTFRVTITAVPDAPKFLYHIPNGTISEDAPKTFLAYLPNVFYDPDSDPLIYSASNLNPTKTGILLSNDSLFAITIRDSNGIATIIVTSNDLSFLSRDTFLLTVAPVNDPPSLVSAMADTSFLEDFTERFVYKLSSYFRDAESAALTFSAVDVFAGLQPRVSNDSLYFKSIVNFFGPARVVVSAYDGQYTVQSTINVQIANVNDAPFVDIATPDQAIIEDSPKIFLNRISTLLKDPDGDALMYGVTAQPSSRLTVTLSNDSIYFLPVPDSSGIVVVTLTASDPSNASARDTFLVTIGSVNDPPRLVNPIPDTSFAQNFGRQFIAKLGARFIDVDSPVLQFTAIPFSSGILTFVSADSLFIQSTKDFFGSVLIRIRASDGSNSTADTFRVTLRDTQAPEIWISALATPWATVVRFVAGAKETLSNLKINVNGQDLTNQRRDNLYYSDFEIIAAGDMHVVTSGADIAGNRDTVRRTYSVAAAKKTEGAMRLSGTPQTFILTRSSQVQKSSSLVFLIDPLEVISTGTEPLRVESSIRTLISGLSGVTDPEKIGYYEYADGMWLYLGGQNSDGQITLPLNRSAVIAIAYDPDRIIVPKRFALEQNFPNPFNPATTIRYHIPVEASVSIRVFNLLGQEIRTLVNEKKSAGIFDVRWDGRTNNGQFASSGVYLYRIEAGRFIQTRKMVLVK